MEQDKINNFKNFIGSRISLFPDAELPEITDCKLKTHKSLIVLNINEKVARIDLSFYFTNKPPVKNIPITVEDEKVKCFKYFFKD